MGSSPREQRERLVNLQLLTREARIVRGVLAGAVLAAQVGWVVQRIRFCHAELRLVE
jgi:hypothetical protein